jgi:hypothetical protein
MKIDLEEFVIPRQNAFYEREDMNRHVSTFALSRGKWPKAHRKSHDILRRLQNDRRGGRKRPSKSWICIHVRDVHDIGTVACGSAQKLRFIPHIEAAQPSEQLIEPRGGANDEICACNVIQSNQEKKVGRAQHAR